MPLITENHESNGLPAFEDQNGVLRFLAKLPPVEDKRKMMANASSVLQPIPRSKWVPIDRRPQFAGGQFILNQQSHGSCVGFSAAGALMASRALAGMQFQKLSGSYVYSWINGGQDQGAVITDALGALTTHGTCLDSTCPVNSIYRSQSKAGDTEAQRFRLRAGLVLGSSDQGTAFDWIGSAIQSHLIPQFAIQVGNNFESYDANGAAGVARGGGNHSVFATGMIQVGSNWMLLMQNSWGSWGPWGNGYVGLLEAHIMDVVQAGGEDSYIHLDEISDPQDPTNPVIPVS